MQEIIAMKNVIHFNAIIIHLNNVYLFVNGVHPSSFEMTISFFFSFIINLLLFSLKLSQPLKKMKKKLYHNKERIMLALNVERDEKNSEHEKETFSGSSCYNKDWVLLTNKSEKVNPLVCYICKQIANNAMELHCDEHENAEQVYLFGEECLQKYLKQSNGKCPIQQHDHCEFIKSKSLRQQVSDLLVICPRQYDLKKNKLKEGTITGEKEERGNQCSYKGKIKEMKDHLDKSCQLTSIQHIILLIKELQLQLQLQTEGMKTVLSFLCFYNICYL
ncbi:hypothetical protein RFI_03483 [Reticulomyxa filosa]|uniref:TRAF-type domain-containing protein n=1 Tax=Reticulomyxa filosa TaxID=46433 RepID=X6P678_RETFI|nr:hypothetical protein RFI_03483 [Reticulomyxa filosa]|eukprot:ETO33618.1 hypothetical protein RFI_03483 [Reticulomyxa filosa]